MAAIKGLIVRPCLETYDLLRPKLFYIEKYFKQNYLFILSKTTVGVWSHMKNQRP
jgi:hypothetical protein